MFTDPSTSAVEEVLSPLETPRPVAETAAKANVDASAVLSENFLSVIHMIAQGNAWLISGLRPSTGIMFSNMPDSSATERQWGRKTTVSVNAGASGSNRYYSGDMDNVQEWLQNNLYVAAMKNPLMSVVGIDVKGIKIAPAKKGAKTKVDRGTAAIHLNMLNIVGGIAFGWLFHDVIVDKSGNVLAGKDRRRYGWTDEDEKQVRQTRISSRKDIEEQAKTALSRIFPDMSKFPFKAGDKAEFEVPIDVMMKETSSPDGEVVDKGSGKPLDVLAAYKKIEDQIKITFKVTVTNVTTEDDDEYSRFHMDVVSTIHVPLNLLYHITDTDPADGDVKRALVYLWLGEALKRQFAAMKPKQKARGRKSSSDDEADAIWPIKISDPVQMKKRLEHEAKLRGNAAKPRTDSRGWSVTEDGEFRLFPDKNLHGQALISYTDEVAQILSALEIEKNRDTRASLLEKLYEARKRLAGKTVVADWAHDTMVYVNTAGNFELESLRGFQAVTASDEMFILNLHMKHPRIYSDINIATQAVMNALDRSRREAYEEIEKRLPNASPETYSLEEKRIRERIPTLSKDDTRRLGSAIEEYEKLYASRVTIAQMAGHDLDKLHMPDGEITKNLITNLDFFRAACKAALEIGLDKVLEDKPDTTRFGMPRWLIETIGNTSADRFVALHQLDQQEKSKTVIGALPEDVIVPNLGQVSTLPHQTDIVSVSAKAPRTHLMAVGTGGGKTLLAIIDAIMLIHRAGAKRVLYMTDSVLTPQLISEINHFSEGKMNAVPLSPDIIRRMKSDGFIKNSDDVVKWVKSFPPNTIFVAETLSMSSTDAAKKKRGQAGAEEPKQRFVKIFDDEPDSIHYMMAGKVLRQFAEICLRCEFDGVIIDEAQRIRGLQGATPTNVGGAARRFLSRANFRREMTGTPAHNNPEDPVKLTLTVMPIMFGTLQEAVDYYNLRDAKSTDTAEGLKRLGDQLTSGPMAYTTKTREDWSFALPSMKTTFVSRKLTPRQSTFYEKMMADIMMRFEAGDIQPTGDMAEGEAEAVTAEAEQDDATNGGENGNGDEGGEDEVVVGGKKFKEAKLRLMFEPVRQFLAAPDRLVVREGVRGQRNTYMMSIEDGETPSGMDLMSPHVETVGTLIIEHMKKPNSGKILVFGQNLCTSEHLERWLPKRFPELSDKLIRYTAKNKGALDRFKSSETHKVLLADMESMKAGHNLQMVDLIIRVQTPWTPGDVEQSTARMYRPDFSGLRLASNVQQIWSLLETNSGGATIDHMMAARVFQKQLAVSELRYRDRSTPASRQLNDAWERFATDRLPRGEQPFKMSPDMIRSFRKEDAEPFFVARDALDEFENAQSRQRRLQMAVAIERATGKSIIDHATGILKGPEAIKTFLQHVMFKLPEGHMMPGSKRVYAPWIPRMQVPDPQKLGLNLPLTEDEALSRLKEGQPVMTEYGPGIVSKITKNKVKVKTGIGELNVDPMLIALAAESGAAELAKMAKNMKAHVLTPPGKMPSKMIRPDAEDAEIIEEPTQEKPKRGRKIVGETPKTPVVSPEAEAEQEEGVKIDAGVIDGMPAFIIADPEVTFVDDIPSTKWHKVGDFVNLSFTTPQALGEFVEAILDEDNPVLRTDKARAAVLRGQALVYLKRKSLRATKAPASPAVTKLWNEILKNPKPKAKGDEPNHFPHLMSIGLEVRMVYMLRTLLPAVKTEIIRLARESGGKVRVESQKNPGFRMALFPTVAAMSKAVQTLKTYAAHSDIVLNDAALAESVKLAKDLYTKMTDPSKLVEKTEKQISKERQEAEAEKPKKKAKPKAKAKEADEAPKTKAKAKAKAKDKKEATKTAKTKKAAAKEAKPEKKAAKTKKASAKKSPKKAAPITAPKKAAKAVTKTPKKAAKKKDAAPPARKKPSRSAGEARA